MYKVPLDSRIGILMRDGRTVYYAFLNGYGRPAFEGSVEAVERALGLRDDRPAVAAAAKLRTFIVTVTPRFIVYSDTESFGSYEIEVDAKTPGDAIKQARQRRRDEDGRFAVPAAFRARLACVH